MGANRWTRSGFESWLAAYGEAWQARDAAAFVALFSDKCAYYWTPLDPPYVGHDAIAGAFTKAVSTQEAIEFSASIVSLDGEFGVARWTCTFTRRPEGHGVRLEGIMLAAPGPDGTCAEFREWWHREEPRKDE